MKKNLLFILFALFAFNFASAQTILAPGDVSIITVNADAPDSFDFINFVDITTGTIIVFTENAYNGTDLLATESTITFTAATDYLAGSVHSFASGTTDTQWATSVATGFSTSGDNLLVYQGDVATPTFLFGIGWASATPWISTGTVSTNNSYVPAGLSFNTGTLVTLGSLDNYQYNPLAGLSGNVSTLRTLISESGSWSVNDAAFFAAFASTFTITTTGEPVIGTISHNPTSVFTSQAVTVTADVTDDGTLGAVSILWGTKENSLTNSVVMTSAKGSYTGDIPSQSAPLTIYYRVKAFDDGSVVSISNLQSYVVVANGPVITNIVQSPIAALVSPADAVNVSADITDDVSVITVTLKWGTATGVYGNTINMTFGTGTTYTTDTDIPAQVDGTSVFYVIEATDGDANVTTSSEMTYISKAATQVATIAELRAGLTNGTIYEFTGEAIVTHEYTWETSTAGVFFTQVFLQDATGGILIYDATSAIVSTDDFAKGDAVTGFKGTLAVYNGLIELIPTNDGSVNSSGNTVTPVVVDLATLTANLSDYESELVTVLGTTFTTADGVAVFTGGANFAIADASGTSTFRTGFKDADYIGTIIPATEKDITCLVGNYNGAQIMARNLADIAAPLYTVTFNVRMQAPITAGTFIVGTDKVNVTGTIFNWAEPGTLPEQEMLDADGDGIYSLTMLVAAGEQQYKYFQNSTWAFGEWNGGDNRVVTITGDATINNTWASLVSVKNIVKNVAVYPNPSNGQFKVSVDGTYNMQVIDLTGKVIQSRQITNTENVNINNKGMYFIKLSDGNAVSVQRVIVK